jgi:hypothetical protein
MPASIARVNSGSIFARAAPRLRFSSGSPHCATKLSCTRVTASPSKYFWRTSTLMFSTVLGANTGDSSITTRPAGRSMYMVVLGIERSPVRGRRSLEDLGERARLGRRRGRLGHRRAGGQQDASGEHDAHQRTHGGAAEVSTP